MMDTPEIARSANEITQADVDALRALGLEDVEYFDSRLRRRCAASPQDFSALGAGSDAAFDELKGDSLIYSRRRD